MDANVKGSNATVASVLLGAADEIRLLGHRAQDAGSVDGPMCAMTAINKASGYNLRLFHEAFAAFKKHIGRDVLVTVWNERQTQASAIAALEGAALEAARWSGK